MAMPICLRLLMHCERRAASRAAWTAGRSRAIRTAMMAMTTSNSIRVKPCRGMGLLLDGRSARGGILCASERGRQFFESHEAAGVPGRFVDPGLRMQDVVIT